MHLLLVNPPFLADVHRSGLGGRMGYLDLVRHHAGGNRAFTLPVEHLGLRSIQASGAARGLAVEVVNALVAGHRALEETFAAIDAAVLRQGVPRVIGFSGPNLVFEEILWLAEACRRRWPEVAILLGHDFGTLNYARILREHPVIDFVCRGEGEHVCIELTMRLLSGQSWSTLEGLAWRGPEGEVAATEPRALDLDALPLPNRGDLPATLAMGMSAGVYTTRGCPYRCTFCTTGETAALLGGTDSYRARTIEGVIEEIARLRRDSGVEFVTVVDDLFVTRGPASQARARAFAEGMLRRNPGMHFMVDVRVDSIEPGLFEYLYTAGLRRVFVGVETGSASQRALYRKQYVATGEDAAPRLQLLRDLGIDVIPGMIAWHPEVGPDELRESLRMIDASGYQGMYPMISLARAYPGTPLYRRYVERGFLLRDWPIADWLATAPEVKRWLEPIVAAAARDGSTFADVREMFLRQVAAWEAAG